MLEIGDKVRVEHYDSIGTIVNTDFRPTLIIEWSDKTRSKVLETDVYPCAEIRLTRDQFQKKVIGILNQTECRNYVLISQLLFAVLEEELFGGVNDG